MYSQQEKAKPCTQCAQNNVQTLIMWRPNPEKAGMINQKTGRAYMRPWDVNKNDWHSCPYYNPPSGTTTTTTTKPPFTPNDKTGENILQELKNIGKQQDLIIEYLQVLAEKSIKQGITPADRINIDGRTNIPPEHRDYQNNTAYQESEPEWK